MRFLILYVTNDRGDDRTTHAKCPISLLPCEFVAFLTCPSGRVRFDGKNRLGQSQCWGNSEEEMNVIFHPSCGEDRNVEFFANAGCVGPHSGPKFFWHKFLAIFGAEHNVNHILRVCVGHVPHLRRWTSLCISYPALTHWARFWHASGVCGVRGGVPGRSNGISYN